MNFGVDTLNASSWSQQQQSPTQQSRARAADGDSQVDWEKAGEAQPQKRARQHTISFNRRTIQTISAKVLRAPAETIQLNPDSF
jgi:hypothetical protein